MLKFNSIDEVIKLRDSWVTDSIFPLNANDRSALYEDQLVKREAQLLLVAPQAKEKIVSWLSLSPINDFSAYHMQTDLTVVFMPEQEMDLLAHVMRDVTIKNKVNIGNNSIASIVQGVTYGYNFIESKEETSSPFGGTINLSNNLPPDFCTLHVTGQQWLLAQTCDIPPDAVVMFLPDDTKLVLCEVIEVTYSTTRELKYRPVLLNSMLGLTSDNKYK